MADGRLDVESVATRRLERLTHDHGLCRGHEANPDDWFPATQNRTFIASEAERLCGECPVRSECLELALRHESSGGRAWGIWGGSAPWQRHQLVDERTRSSRAAGDDSRRSEMPATSRGAGDVR